MFRYDYFHNPEPSWKRQLTMFEHAPQLREVSIIHLPPSFLALPWAQLTSLVAEDFSLDDCLQALRLTPSLIDCSFGWVLHLNGLTEPTMEAPPLIYLESLKFYGTYHGYPDMLLALTLPALTKLHRLPYDPETFVEFLSRSSAILRELSMNSHYHILMEGMPALSVLSIKEVSLGKITRIARLTRLHTQFTIA
ncbi:hypothetical protein B0H19DRAFT_1169627 [Mycena capillaripes]|nr:hypothetical protein B0H19DRAFT_1169627 [Mycena capillaripes]